MGYKSFAVVGAGNLGKPIVEALVATQGTSVVVLHRKTSTPPTGLPASVRTEAVDYDDIPGLTSVLKVYGVEAIVCTIGRNIGLEKQINIADAAKAAGVKLFMPSEFGMPADGIKEGLLGVKNRVIKHSKTIGLPYVIVHNGLVSEYVPWTAGVGETDKFYIVGKGDVPASYTGISDIAGYVAHVLITVPNEKLENATLRIEGQRATFLDLGSLYPTKTVTHVDVFPPEVPFHDVRDVLFQRLDLGAGSSGWSEAEQKDDPVAASSGNSLWEGHKWKTVKETLGL